MSGSIADRAASAFTASNTLVLARNNTYSGGTAVSSGLLVISNAAAFESAVL